MPHIHTNPGDHDSTTSAYIIRFDTPQPQLLLHMHKKYGKLMQPGGHVELQENPWQGVLHEITEETGYSLEQLTVLQPKQRLLKLTRAVLHPVSVCDNTHEADDGHYHSDRTYAFAVDTEPVNVPSEGESTIFQWVTAVELANMKDSEVGTQLKEIGAYALTVCASEWERVPLSEFEA